ncbi:phage tail fiber protein [Fimbriiglobus ruber]|uniref:Phage protein n=1 Tax=Fimbriiglobus ruber TaxID=1908690 RepID=A0A225DKR2_9BACT|nr:hypothetical protein [Fimbriiglobus ruber]OWK42070.1 hypothetical protein FRUB_04148 [Fimbriiglobus ruber]
MTGTNPTFAGDLLALIFNATTIANIAINATSSPITNVYVSLHTADPTSGTQATSEAAYTSYARVGVARTSGGWTVSTNTVVPVATISFPAATGGSETESYAGLGQSASGATLLFFAGSISPTISVSNGVTPQLSTSSQLTLS